MYRGEYVALRTQRVEPKQRIRATYGRSSHKPRDQSEHIHLPSLVSEPIVTPEEFDLVQQRLDRNKARGEKVVMAYLLRGMVRCEHCSRHWRGKATGKRGKTYYSYLCNGMEDKGNGFRCDASSMSGPKLEERVWAKVVEFLSQPELFLGTIDQSQQANNEAIDHINAAIRKLDQRRQKVEAAEARAYNGYARGLASAETYRRVGAEFRAERAWIAEEHQRLEKQLQDAQR